MTDINPQPQTAVIPPLPLQMGIGQAITPEGQQVVLISIATPWGVHNFPIDGATARKFGVELQKIGSAAASGLVVAQ